MIRILVAFFVAIAAGSAAIFYNIYQPWLPLGIVVLYGGLLWIFSATGTTLTGEAQDSPYYVGFLLTLIALFVAFSHADSPDLLIGTIGSAILTTVAGLVVRAFFHLRDREELHEREVIETMHEQIRQTVAGFHSAHLQLVGLVSTFVESRSSLLDREKTISEAYVERLNQLLTRVTLLEGQFADDIAEILADLQPVVGKLAKYLEETKARVEEHIETLVEFHEQGLNRLNSSIESFEARHLEETETAIIAVRKRTERVMEPLDSLSRSIAGMVAAVESIPIEGVLSSLANTGEKVSREFTGIVERGRSLAEMLGSVESLLERTRKDLGDIDMVLTDFVRLLGRKVEAVREDNRGLFEDENQGLRAGRL